MWRCQQLRLNVHLDQTEAKAIMLYLDLSEERRPGGGLDWRAFIQYNAGPTSVPILRFRLTCSLLWLEGENRAFRIMRVLQQRAA